MRPAPLPMDLPPDDVLVPVLSSAPTSTPRRVISGKKNDDDRNMATKHCMCCDYNVRFPRELKVFRCSNCLTVNDIEPYRPKPRDADADVTRHDTRRPRLIRDCHAGAARKSLVDCAPSTGHPNPSRLIDLTPLSVQRSKAIIDQCLVTYFESRCKRVKVPRNHTLPLPKVVLSDPFVNGTLASSEKTTNTDTQTANPELPVTPAGTPSATIKDFADFDWFPVSPTYNDAPSSAKPLQTPITPSPVNVPGGTSPAINIPPPPNRPPPAPPAAGSGSASWTRDASFPTPSMTTPKAPEATSAQVRYDRVKTIFKPLEDYMLGTYGNYECLNTSFSTVRQRAPPRARSESAIRTPPPEPMEGASSSPMHSLDNMDAKTLLVGDFAENGQWWIGHLDRNRSNKDGKQKGSVERKRLTTSRTPHMDWDELKAFYDSVHSAGIKWWEKLDDLKSVDQAAMQEHLKGPRNAQEIDQELREARQHVERTLLKITENLLKRPGRLLTEPDNIRFLVIILMNPSLYPEHSRAKARSGSNVHPRGAPSQSHVPLQAPQDTKLVSPKKPLGYVPGRMGSARDTEQHTGILKRLFGLVAESSDSCHRYLIGWLSRLPENRFVQIIDLVACFVTYRLSRRKSRTRASTIPQNGGLIPDLSGSAHNTSAQIRLATGLGGNVQAKDTEPQSVVDYSEDWQLKAAAKFMALLFAANNSWQSRRAGATPAEMTLNSLSQPRVKTHGQLLPTSDFYNTLLDYQSLVPDFKAWESKKAKFTFCQYPFFLSMGKKIEVLEYDARRQMELKAREAYFNSVTSHRAIDGYFHLRVRRDCMVDDSLRQISAGVGAGQEELKKGLKVHFTGEEGVDAGGLRKEWFLIIVRDIFDPNHGAPRYSGILRRLKADSPLGMFLYDDDSHTCYFNPNTFETSDQYYLVGALLGLAIYNSTILDVALPPFAFRKLLAAAPPSSSNPSLQATGSRIQMTYTVDDLAEYRPALAAGLRQLLNYDGDVYETFCRDFVAPVEHYGVVTEVPLCPGGEKKPVTNENRQEYVDLYVRYLLDVSVARQFEPFKRGFFTVCAGNALSLFRPEEIELLIRGSDEALDVDSLRAVAVYENWRSHIPPHQPIPNPAETVPVVGWFWDFFKKVEPVQQRRILSFITGSDRIPAVGATNLVLRICCGGDGIPASSGRMANNAIDAEKERERLKEKERFPIARTCFNMLVLWGYESREKLEDKLWRAVCESEGFGLK